MAARWPPGPEPTTMRSYFSMVGGASIPNGRRGKIQGPPRRAGRRQKAEGRRQRKIAPVGFHNLAGHLLTGGQRSAMMLKIWFLRRGSDFLGLRLFLAGVSDRLAGLHTGLRKLGQHHVARDGEHPPLSGRRPWQARDPGAARRRRK